MDIKQGDSTFIKHKNKLVLIDTGGIISFNNSDYKVSNNTSEIKLITTNDINSKISVVIKTNDDVVYGILSGYEKNYALCLRESSVL